MIPDYIFFGSPTQAPNHREERSIRNPHREGDSLNACLYEHLNRRYSVTSDAHNRVKQPPHLEVLQFPGPNEPWAILQKTPWGGFHQIQIHHDITRMAPEDDSYLPA